MKKSKFPKGWNEARVRRVLAHYESQTDEEAVAEDEAAYASGRTIMAVPRELVPTVRELIARRQARLRRRGRKRAGSAAHAKPGATRTRR
jgi:hypothetical protein